MGLTLDVLVDGTRSAALSGRWRSLTVIDGKDYSSDSASLVLSAPATLAIEIPPLGVPLRFAVDGARLGGLLYATAIRGDARAGSITIEAAARHPRSSLKQSRRVSYAGQSLAEIAAAIAERASLVAVVSPALGSVVPTGAIQSDESDDQFLRRLVARLNGVYVEKDGRITILGAGDSASASGSPLPAVKIDLRASGAWATWRRSEAAIVDVAQATYLEADGATPAFLTLGEEPEGRQTVRRKLPGQFGTRDEAERAIRRALVDGRSGFDYIEIETSLMPEARALYPVSLSGVLEGFPTELTIHQVRHELGRRVATTTVTARP